MKATETLPGNRFRYTDPDSGGGSWVTVYFGFLGAGSDDNAPPPVGELHPVAFLVEMDPGRLLRPHYHWANQFQVFVAGDGTLGKKPLDIVSLHYADAYTPYGPITSGECGLSYLTLRNSWEPGQRYMPENRAELAAAQRKPRAATADHVNAGGPGSVLFAAAPDGMCASFHRLVPGASLTGPDPSTGGGQYWLELATMSTGGAPSVPDLSVTFLGPDEPQRSITAGSSAREMLVMQFPRFPAVTDR